MVFSSLIFLWLFLPIVFILNFCIKSQYSNILLLGASLFFYAWGEPCYVFLLMISIIANWGFGRGIAKHRSHRGGGILIAGVSFNLLMLAYFKYAAFAVQILNELAKKEIFPVPKISLPIGISFYTFQAISYIIDVYRGETEVQDKLVNTALYISFFPQLIAGPIVKYRDINKQIENRIITSEKISYGFRQFIYGLSKKVLISNILGKSADLIFSMDVTCIGGKMAWSSALFYTFQIYYDFSGYSDMAIGLGKMFGFDIQENFKYPYLSRSIGEFWRKWHISLGSWFREYVYIPLGGNRKGEIRTYINLAVVFFLTGLWHGANYTFIVWGSIHGILSILERKGLHNFLKKSRVLSHLYVFFIVNFGWVIFRIDTLKDGLLFIKRMLFPMLYWKYDIALWKYCNKKTIFIFICAVLGMGIIQKIVPEEIKESWIHSVPEGIYCALLLILCILEMASNTYNPFIYFQF